MGLQLNAMRFVPDSGPITVAQSVMVARAQAHDAFDPIWRMALYLPCFQSLMNAQGRAAHKARSRIAKSYRRKAYAWLAEQLGLSASEAHIRFFDAATCQRVVDMCHGMDAAALREWCRRRGK